MIGMNTEMRNIRLVIETPVTISFTICVAVPIKVCGKSPALPAVESSLSANFDSYLSANFDGSYEWQKGNRSGLLYRMGEGALMLGATPGQSSGNDFAALGDKISQ